MSRIPNSQPTAPRMEPDSDLVTVRPEMPKIGKKTGLIGAAKSRWCMSENHEWCGGTAQRFSLDLDRSVRARCECECHGRFV